MGTERRMRAKAPTYRLLFLAAVLGLTACGGDEEAKEAPRPVLVVRAVGDATVQASAFAGEIRAREESPLSFRIGGQIVRRVVDAGDRVKRGDVLAELDPGDARLEVEAAQAQAAAADAELARASAERLTS